MAAIPTLTEEDAKRPNRERESLVGEQGRIVNRMKPTLARLGIRNFNPKLKKAADHLEDLRTPEGSEPSRPRLAVAAEEAASLDRSCARRRVDRVGRGEETGFQVEQRNLGSRLNK
jgi:transposase